ncbi:LOW QUALITY PROTEIN: molybdopterin biosynthesis protein, partial [Streptomyces viridosporus ATCC 14672]
GRAPGRHPRHRPPPRAHRAEPPRRPGLRPGRGRHGAGVPAAVRQQLHGRVRGAGRGRRGRERAAPGGPRRRRGRRGRSGRPPPRRSRPGGPHHDRRPAPAGRRDRRPRGVDRRRPRRGPGHRDARPRPRPGGRHRAGAGPPSGTGPRARARPGQRRPGRRPRPGGRDRPRPAADLPAGRDRPRHGPGAPAPARVVLSTGSELVQPGEELRPGQIHDSNSFALTAAARDAGAIAYRVGAVADDPETLRDTIEDQLVRADLMVTSGGVSVGAYDVVREALSSVDDEDEPGSGIDFRRLAMQPGKPQGFGSIGPDHTPLLALPGNPVSSYVSFELFVRPAIRTLMGLTDVHRPRTRARLTADGALTSPKGRRQFLRGRYADGAVTPVGGAGSHLVAALAQANALIVVPEDVESVAPGTEVEVVLLG